MTKEELEHVKWGAAEIRQHIEAGFYGELSFKIVAGRIVLVEKRETKKPPV